MMPRSEYVAQRDIDDPVTKARAYNRGDLVPSGVVENLGLEIGSGGDVLPLEGDLLPKPGKGAKRKDWVAYAIAHGKSEKEIDPMSIKDLEAAFPDK
jgi:hypothetical protein